MDQDDNTGEVRNVGPKERDDEKIPPAPLCQRGEFGTGMMRKVEGREKDLWLCGNGLWLGQILRFSQDDNLITRY
jgi:hypothetical protein